MTRQKISSTAVSPQASGIKNARILSMEVCVGRRSIKEAVQQNIYLWGIIEGKGEGVNISVHVHERVYESGA
jgi:hypothetical protein